MSCQHKLTGLSQWRGFSGELWLTWIRSNVPYSNYISSWAINNYCNKWGSVIMKENDGKLSVCTKIMHEVLLRTCTFCIKDACVGFSCLWVGSKQTGIYVHYNASEGRVLNWRCYLGYPLWTRVLDTELEIIYFYKYKIVSTVFILNSGTWPTWRTILLCNTFISVLYMFRANTCSSSGGQFINL